MKSYHICLDISIEYQDWLAYSEETCLIRFADGTTHEYHVPVMKIQEYSLEMIEEKHLIILLPFLPIRFRKYLQRKRITREERNELTEFIMKCIMIIEREKANGTLTELADEVIKLQREIAEEEKAKAEEKMKAYWKADCEV